MASYDWLTPLIGVVGALLAAGIAAWVTWVIGQRQLRQQKEQFDREWQRRLAHEQQQRINASREAIDERETKLQTDEERYRDWVTQQYRHLNITGLRTRTPVEVELERIYVSLRVDSRAIAHLGADDNLPDRPGAEDGSYLIRRHDETEAISMAAALNAIDHDRIAGLVILGGPGTGKTTVLRYLALTYARGLHGERLAPSLPPRLPLLIPLRTVTSSGAPSLAEHMTQLCQRLGCVVDPEFFDAQLKDHRCLVLLDGLDEVADEQQRRSVSRWIEQQSRAYAGNSFVVTCRPAGFREDFLPPGFLRLAVQNFGDEEVELFAQNWCRAVEMMLKGDTAEAHNKASSDSADLIQAIKANERVKALAVNPLMLSIIALVHRYRARLPDRRVDLYAECVEVLLVHWDEAKELTVTIPSGQALQVLQPLALWMHEHKSSDDERLAHFEEIEPVMARSLAGIGMPDADAARTFLNSIRDRSGLLVEYGTDVFGFQHQTFQEYLTAKEVVEHQREGLLIEHLGEGYWREVTLLYAGIRDTTGLLQGVLDLPDDRVMQHWELVQRVQGEAVHVESETREALASRPFEALTRASDAVTAARAAIHVRQAMPDYDRIAAAFEAADDSLTKGHLALLLSETGNPHAGELLRPQLDTTDDHVRYLSALALVILGLEDDQALENELMVHIPAGSFWYGDKDERERVETKAFAIDRFPLTNGQFRRFMEAGGYSERRFWSEAGWRWKEAEEASKPPYIDHERFGKSSLPVVTISWYEAEAYANWAGKRLPTEQEWERAARGDVDGREYPWGDDFELGWANVENEVGQTTPIGSYPVDMSPCGCYDMAGNVWEWTDSQVRQARVLRGGSWILDRAYARCSARGWFGPRYRDLACGVRLSRTL